MEQIATETDTNHEKNVFLQKRLQTIEKEYKDQVTANEKLTKELAESKKILEQAKKDFDWQKEREEELVKQLDESGREMNEKIKTLQIQQEYSR